MINIEYFASKVRREHDLLNEEVREERFEPPCRRKSPEASSRAEAGLGDERPEVEPPS